MHLNDLSSNKEGIGNGIAALPVTINAFVSLYYHPLSSLTTLIDVINI